MNRTLEESETVLPPNFPAAHVHVTSHETESSAVAPNGDRAPLLLTAVMAGELLMVSEGTLRKLTRDQVLRPVEILPGMWRYPYAEVVRLARVGIHGVRRSTEENSRQTVGSERLGHRDRPFIRALLALTGALASTDPLEESRIRLSKAEAAALGANIRCAREKLGLSQGQFARKIGVRQQKVSEWERGFRLRQVITAWRLADVVSQI